MRFETDPGRQMQNDWGEVVTVVGGETRKFYFSVNTLCFSRRFHFWGTDRCDAEHTYEGIILAFEHFGGVTGEVLVDNQKSTVIKHRIGEKVQFNERFLDKPNVTASFHGPAVPTGHGPRGRTSGW